MIQELIERLRTMGHSKDEGTLNEDRVEEMIRHVCARIGDTYTGYHETANGFLDSEACPEICFHGTQGIYHLLIGSHGSLLKNPHGHEVARFGDIRKSGIFT